jgi:endonuclease III
MTQKDDEAQELADIMKEESTRGRPHPKRASTASQERKMRQFVRMIASGKCEDREVANAIRELGPQEGSPEFQRLWNIWLQFRGRRS